MCLITKLLSHADAVKQSLTEGIDTQSLPYYHEKHVYVGKAFTADLAKAPARATRSPAKAPARATRSPLKIQAMRLSKYTMLGADLRPNGRALSTFPLDPQEVVVPRMYRDVLLHALQVNLKTYQMSVSQLRTTSIALIFGVSLFIDK